jgi:hypothetical protein
LVESTHNAKRVVNATFIFVECHLVATSAGVLGGSAT